MYTLHASILAEYFSLSSEIMETLLVTKNSFQKKVTILHVQNSWKCVEFAVILVGTPFKTI